MTFGRLIVTTLRLALPLYLLSLVLGAIGTALALSGLAAVAAERPWLVQLLGGDWLNVLVEVGLSTISGPPSDRTAVGLLALEAVVGTPLLILLQWIGYTFLSGGILERLLAGGSASASRARFWAGCRRWFWPFARLGVVSALAALLLLVVGAVACALLSLAAGMTVSALLLAAWVAVLLGWLELARAAMVWHGDRSVRSVLARATHLLPRPRALLVWLFLALPALGLVVLTLSVPAVGDAASPAGTLTTVIVGQVVAFIGAWLKVIRLAAASRLVASGTPHPLAPPCPSPAHGRGGACR